MTGKRITAIFAAALLAMGMFGCASAPASSQGGASSTNTPTGSGGGGTEEFTPSYPIVEEKITVKGALIGDFDLTEPRLAYQKLEEVTNIHVDWEVISTDAVAVYLASDNWPDFFEQALDSTYINDYGVIGGRFVDYTEYLKYMPNLQQTFEDYPDARKSVKELNGAMYVLPYVGKDCTAVTARMYYREDTFQKAGCGIPTTIDEFYDCLVKLKNMNGGAAPLADERTDFIWSSFGPGKNPNFEDDGTGKVIYNRISEQYKLYLEYMKKLYAEGLLHQEYLTLDAATKLSLAQEGLIAVGHDGLSALSEDAFPSGKVELNQLAPLTSEYDDKREVVGWCYCRPGTYQINSKSKYIVELCRMFDATFAKEEVVKGTGVCGILFHYGQEGVSWKWSNDDHTEYELILPKELEGVKAFGTYVTDSWIFGGAVGRFDLFANATTSTEGNNKARQQGFVKNLIPYQEEVAFPGNYLKFSEEEQAVLDDAYVTIQSYVTEMAGKFITGVSDVESEWESYVGKIDQMGLEKVLAAYQAAYDRWNA